MKRELSSDHKIRQQFVSQCSGSVFTPSGQRKSARISKKNRKISVCNDALYDVLSKLDNVQLGLGMALVSHRFNAVVKSCFKIRKCKLARLWIRQGHRVTKENQVELDNSAELVTYEGKQLPFAKSPPPEEILGFKSISISYIDADVMEFLEHCRPLFNSCEIALQCDGIFCQGEQFLQIWPLFCANIAKMKLEHSVLGRLTRLIGPTVLRDCANLRFVTTSGEGFGLETPADDAVGASTGQALLKWLYTARADGHPKVLTTIKKTKKLMDDIAKDFSSATTAVSFIVRFCPWGMHTGAILSPFELSNATTAERLTLRRVRNDLGNETGPKSRRAKFDFWLLERSPTKKDEKQWALWANEHPFDDSFWDEDSTIYVNLDKRRQLEEPVQCWNNFLASPSPATIWRQIQDYHGNRMLGGFVDQTGSINHCRIFERNGCGRRYLNR